MHRHSTHQDPKRTPVAPQASPTHEDISLRAYEIYVRQGHQEGHCEQNWHQAERDLRETRQGVQTARRESQNAGRGSCAVEACDDGAPALRFASPPAAALVAGFAPPIRARAASEAPTDCEVDE